MSLQNEFVEPLDRRPTPEAGAISGGMTELAWAFGWSPIRIRAKAVHRPTKSILNGRDTVGFYVSSMGGPTGQLSPTGIALDDASVYWVNTVLDGGAVMKATPK